MPIERQPILRIRATSPGIKQTINNGRARLTGPGIRRFGKATKRATRDLRREYKTLGSIDRSLRGNQNDYVQARVRPLEQALASQLADTERGLSRRGVFGSLATNELTRIGMFGQRELGDQRAMALNEALNARLAVSAARQGVTESIVGLARDRLTQELAGMGVNLGALQLAMSDQLPLSEVAGGTQTTREQGGMDIGAILRGIGAIAGSGS